MSTPRERFQRALHFEPPLDRIPMVEWAPWWDLTFARWKTEGLPADMTVDESLAHFGLDPLVNISAAATSRHCPYHPHHHGAGLLTDEISYDDLRPYLYTDDILDSVWQQTKHYQAAHERGDVSIRVWLDGWFWFPRTLFGIEKHLYAFYDEPELMHRIAQDLADFNRRVAETVFPVLQPDMVGFAEDMSYNHGPMLSEACFDEFLMPYYQQVAPIIQAQGIPVLIDSDGDITRMIPWMRRAGIQGVYPLERQAGVDIPKIRAENPDFLMLGGFDKMVMDKGEAAIRAEFERLLPAMKTGGFIPSMDHQTPPACSLENYYLYLRLFREYTTKAAQGAV